MRRGVTLIELVVVLAVVGLVMAWGLPQIAEWPDRLAVDGAAREMASLYAVARLAAVGRGTRVRIEFGPDSLRAVFEGARDSVFRVRPGPAHWGVAFQASRRVIRVGAGGYGWGAANTTVTLTRGARRTALVISRLGRLRWRH
jgi:prepilin-type N-terminal cleavage/methylation domain-containing protein